MQKKEQKPITESVLVQVQRRRDNLHPHHFKGGWKNPCVRQDAKLPSRAIRVKTESINNRQKLANFVYQEFGDGHYNVSFWSHKKNQFHCSPCKRAEVYVTHKTYFDDFGKEQIDTENCTFKWIIYGKPTKNNRTGRVDRMYVYKNNWWKQ